MHAGLNYIQYGVKRDTCYREMRRRNRPDQPYSLKKGDYFEMYQPVWVSLRIFSAVFRVKRLTPIIATREIINA